MKILIFYYWFFTYLLLIPCKHTEKIWRYYKGNFSFLFVYCLRIYKFFFLVRWFNSHILGFFKWLSTYTNNTLHLNIDSLGIISCDQRTWTTQPHFFASDDFFPTSSSPPPRVPLPSPSSPSSSSPCPSPSSSSFNSSTFFLHWVYWIAEKFSIHLSWVIGVVKYVSRKGDEIRLSLNKNVSNFKTEAQSF